jgi:hypothetical protein
MSAVSSVDPSKRAKNLGFGADRENGAIKQSISRSATGGVEHKVSAVLTQRFGCTVDQATLFWLYAQIEGLALANLAHVLLHPKAA